MLTCEQEFNRLLPKIQRLCRFSLVGKKLVVKGKNNLITSGPNIIVGNHAGNFKDVAALMQVVSRPVFFIANQMIFDKKELHFLIRKHLKRNFKDLGLAIDLLFRPLKSLLVNFVSENVSKVGTVPADLYYGKKQAIRKCQEYLEKGRAIIALQGRGRIMKHDPNPFVPEFRKGASIMSYNLYLEKGIVVPVTPIAFFGTHKSMVTPAKIQVNIGEPLYVTDYLETTFSETVQRFRAAMEGRVNSLFFELIRDSRDEG
jgi:1-acyl-sn-glycerol-3-phosphate acyltransferase